MFFVDQDERSPLGDMASDLAFVDRRLSDLPQPSRDRSQQHSRDRLDQQLAGDNSAFRQLGDFDFQEYEAGVELVLPVGFRQGHAAVRFAQIQIARDKAVLREQQRQILHDLTATIAAADRSYTQVETNLNRFLAASDALDALEANRQAGLPVTLNSCSTPSDALAKPKVAILFR